MGQWSLPPRSRIGGGRRFAACRAALRSTRCPKIARPALGRRTRNTRSRWSILQAPVLYLQLRYLFKTYFNNFDLNFMYCTFILPLLNIIWLSSKPKSSDLYNALMIIYPMTMKFVEYLYIGFSVAFSIFIRWNKWNIFHFESMLMIDFNLLFLLDHLHKKILACFCKLFTLLSLLWYALWYVIEVLL